MSVENLNFFKEVIDNALTGVTNPDQLLQALELIEDMLSEIGEEDGEVSSDDGTVSDEADDVADTDDIPF